MKKLSLILALLAASFAARAQVITPFYEFLNGQPAASALQPTDKIPVIQSSGTRQATAAQIEAFICTQIPAICSGPVGTVNSVALSAGSADIVVGGTNPITSSGTLTVDLSSTVKTDLGLAASSVQSVAAGSSAIAVAGSSSAPTVDLAAASKTNLALAGTSVQGVTAGSGSITIGGSSTSPTVDVSAGTKTTISLASTAVQSVSAASGNVVVAGTSTAPTVDLSSANKSTLALANTSVQSVTGSSNITIGGASTAPTVTLVAAPAVSLANATSLPCSAHPALTGDTTSSAGSCATTTLTTGGVAFAPSATTDATLPANINFSGNPLSTNGTSINQYVLAGSATRTSSAATLPAISSTDNIGFIDWTPSSTCNSVFPVIGTSGITGGGFQTIIVNSAASSQPPCTITATTSTINGLSTSTIPFYLASGGATAIVWADNSGTNYGAIQTPSSTINAAPEQYWIDTAEHSSTNISNWTFGTTSAVFGLTLWDDAWVNSSTGFSVTRLGSGSNGYYVSNMKLGGYVGTVASETGGTYTFTGTGPASFSGIVRSYGFVPTGIGFCGISNQPIFNAPIAGYAGVCTGDTQAVEWNTNQGQINFGNITVDESGSPTYFWQDTSQPANQTIWDVDTTGGNWSVRTLTDTFGTGINAIQAVRGTSTAIASIQIGFGATSVGIGGTSSTVQVGQTTSTTNIYGATIGIGNASDTITVGATSSATQVNGAVTLGGGGGSVNVGSGASTVQVGTATGTATVEGTTVSIGSGAETVNVGTSTSTTIIAGASVAISSPLTIASSIVGSATTSAAISGACNGGSATATMGTGSSQMAGSVTLGGATVSSACTLTLTLVATGHAYECIGWDQTGKTMAIQTSSTTTTSLMAFNTFSSGGTDVLGYNCGER